MQELIEWIDEQEDLFEFDKGVISNKEKYLLEMEKQQIINAYNEELFDYRQENGEKYYNETFKN